MEMMMRIVAALAIAAAIAKEIVANLLALWNSCYLLLMILNECIAKEHWLVIAEGKLVLSPSFFNSG